MTKSILLIQFSSRNSGNSSAISKYLTEYYTTETVRSYVMDSHIAGPCGNCDYECLQPGKKCPNLTSAYVEIMDHICNADLVYFIVPSYCGYPCANYYAFNEHSVGYFNMDRVLMKKYMDIPKRFIVISNSEGDNFNSAMQQQVADKPDILYLKSGKYGKKSIAGDILDSEAAKADLNAFLSTAPV